MRRQLRTTRGHVVDEIHTLNTAYLLGRRLVQQLATGNLDVSTTQKDLAAAQLTLNSARATLASQTMRRSAVHDCLQGVQRALDHTRLADTAGATAALRAAAPACQTALSAPGQPVPVLAFDFADPFVLRANGEYFAYATNAAGGSVQMARSRNLVDWDFVGNVLAGLPAWATPGSVWAPAAMLRLGGAVLYYTVRERATGRQCVSVAIGGGPAGPFLDPSSAPLECGTSGAIDPSPFVDVNGDAYLLNKTEGPARIGSRLLAPDGRTFAGPPHELLAPTQRWEGGNVEAPSMLLVPSGYWLFFSGNNWNSRGYAEGIAHCSGPAGPCQADGANPVLASTEIIVGPGGGEVFNDGGSWRLAYHAYRAPLVGYPNSRLLHFARIGFDGRGRPLVMP
jgi:beta-xylosidase